MKKIMGRINGLIRIAEKREKKGTEMDRLIGRQVARNLKMVKKIIGEEIVCCPECLSFVSIDDLLQEGSIGRFEADLAEKQGNAGMCVVDGDDGVKKFVRSCDFCSFGARGEGGNYENV